MRMWQLARQIAIQILNGYHRHFSPFLPRACRFYPTCSVYASEAVQRHGLFKGALLSLRRIGRCHPWNPGGYDPVK